MTLIAQGSYAIKRSAKNGKDAGINLLKWQEEWTLGSDDLPNWRRSGTVAENERIMGNNPFGLKSIMWKCKEQGNGEASGGFNTFPFITLDASYAYRYCVFVFKLKNSGILLHGTHGVVSIAGVANDNPYFVATPQLPIGQWALVVGIIHPNSATIDSGISGVYDMSGKKIINGDDYKQSNPPQAVNFRSYNYYDGDTSQVQYFYNPMLHKLDGTEPSIEQMLQLSARKEIDAARATSEAYAAAQAELARVKAEANADGKITAAEARAIADATAKANAARDAAIAAAAADASAKIDAVKTTYDNQFESTDKQFLSVLSETKTYADNAINNIKVGGNNLIINSDNIYNIAQKAVENNAFTFNQPDADGSSKATLVTFVKDGLFRIGVASKDSILKLKENTTYTYSIWVKPKVGTQIKLGISAMTGDVITLPSGWSRVKFTTSFNAANKWTIEQGWFFVDIGGINAGDSFYFYHPQLEEGNVCSAWTENTADVKEAIKKTLIQQTADSINLAVKKIEVGNRNYALLTSKKIFSDKLYNIQNWIIKLYDISPSLTVGEVTLSFNAKINITSTKPTSKIWVQGSLQLGYATFGYLPAGLGIDQKFTFTTTIDKIIPGGYLYLRCDDVIGTIEVSELILVKGNKVCNWQLAEEEKINEGNILSSINLSEEGVKIDGKKVEITGELLAQIIKAKGLNVGDKTFIDSLGNFKTVNGTFSGKMDATSGSIGNFSIVNGDIIGVDTAKKERIRISTNPLPTLADLFTGYNIISPELNIEFEDYFEIDSQDNSERTQVVCSFRRTIHLEERTTIQLVGQGATFSHRLQGGGTDRFRGATRNEDINFYNSSNQLVATGDWNKPIDIPAGDIIIEITSRFVAISPYNWDDPSIYRLMISTGWQGIIAQGTTEKTYIGADGFYSVFGSGEYIYFKRGVGLVTKGKTDTGGVLASGSVSTGGTQTNVWGAKSSDRGATKASAGVFNVPHKIGHTNYTITATSHHSGISMSIVSRSAYSVQLAAVENGSEYSVGFDYTIIGQN